MSVFATLVKNLTSAVEERTIEASPVPVPSTERHRSTRATVRTKMYTLLEFLSEGDATITMLSNMTKEVDISTRSRVSNLVKAGYVRRSLIENNTRRFMFSITDHGQKALESYRSSQPIKGV